MKLEKIKQKALALQPLSKEEALELSKFNNQQKLYAAAEEITRHFFDQQIELCTITNARSGKCSQDCKWCAQSAHNQSSIDVYEMVPKEKAIREACEAGSKGVHRHSLVTSGRTVSDKTLDQLIELYNDIKQKTNIQLCASMGLLTPKQMKRLKKAGVSRYHCNIETAPSYFPKLVSTHTLEEKIKTIRAAQQAGLAVCSGGIIGMGETMTQRIEMAFTLRELGIKSIPINILTPIKGTPLEHNAPLEKEEILTTIALFRFINPDAIIRLGGGRILIKAYQEEVLRAGANAILTGDYLTTSGSKIDDDLQMLQNAGFSIDRDSE